MNLFYYLRFIICLIFIIGCSDYNNAETKKEIIELRKNYSELQQKYSELQANVNKLNLSNEAHNALEIAGNGLFKRLIKLEGNQYSDILLNSSSKGYQRLDTSSGFFLISLDEIKSYANGYKLILRVGNISTARYTGFKFKIKYGKEYDSKESIKDIHYLKQWEKSLKEKEISFTNELEPGVWNRVEVVISPAKSEELGHILLSMETNIINLLYKRYKP